MVLSVALLLQAPLAAEQIHAEDTKVLEAALLGFWAKDNAKIDTIYVPDLTFGPVRAEDDLIVDEKDPKKPLRVGTVLRKNYLARNAYPVSLAWFRPSSKVLQVVPKNDPSQHSYRSSGRGHDELRQYSWVLMPGYDANRTHAFVCLGVTAGMHWEGATVLLTKTDGSWKVADVRSIYNV